MGKLPSVLTGFRCLRSVAFGSRDDAHASRYRMAEWFATRFGSIYVGEDLKLWLKDAGFHAAYARFAINHRMAERTYTVRELVRSIDHVPGDTAEIGVFEGKTSFFIRQARGRGEHHIFDSFEGLSEPSDDDAPHDPDAFHWKRGDLSASEQIVRQNLAGFDGVHLHKGWIPERFDDVADRQFAFVHIDVDLYHPTLHSVAFFYARLNPGGMLVCDDYGFTSCHGAYKAMHEFLDDRPEHIIHLPTGQGVIIKQ